MGEIILKDLQKSFGEVSIIKNINIHIIDGEFVVIVGPSGCGTGAILLVDGGYLSR